MNNRLILLTLLACLIATLDIRKGSIINKPLFDQYYPSGSEEYQYEKMVLSNNTDLLEIARTISSWKINAQISQDFTNQQRLAYEQGGIVIDDYYFRTPINQILRLNYNPRTLQPGTIIQLSNPNDYSQGLIPNYVGEDKINKFNLIFSNGLSGRIEGVTNAAYNKILNERIKQQIDMFNKKIELYIYKFSEVEAALRNLGLTTSAYKNLLLSQSRFAGGDFNRRTTIVLFQPLFSVSVDFPRTSKNKRMNLVQAIFTSKYKFDQFIGTSMYGYWNYNNLPQIISQTNYGRLLIITIQENKLGQTQIQSLLGCNKQSNIINEDCFDSAMTKIQSNPSIRSYVGGVNPNAAYGLKKNMPIMVQNVNWRKVFFEFISADLVEQLQPLSSNMMNLLGQKYIQIDTMNFYKMTRSEFPLIDIRIEDVSLSADISFRSAVQSADVQLGKFTSPQIINAGNKIGWNSFILKITLKGAKNNSFFSFLFPTQYQFKLVMNVIINGNQVLKIKQGSKSKVEVLKLQHRLAILT